MWEVQEGLRSHEMQLGEDFRKLFWGWVTVLTFVNTIITRS